MVKFDWQDILSCIEDLYLRPIQMRSRREELQGHWLR